MDIMTSYNHYPNHTIAKEKVKVLKVWASWKYARNEQSRNFRNPKSVFWKVISDSGSELFTYCHIKLTHSLSHTYSLSYNGLQPPVCHAVISHLSCLKVGFEWASYIWLNLNWHEACVQISSISYTPQVTQLWRWITVTGLSGETHCSSETSHYCALYSPCFCLLV